MFPAAHSFFGVVTHTYLASTSSGLNVVATSRPNIGLKVATLRPMFRFGKVTHTYLASKSPGLNVAWPQRRLASMSPGLNVAWPQCRGLNVAGLNFAHAAETLLPNAAALRAGGRADFFAEPETEKK